MNATQKRERAARAAAALASLGDGAPERERPHPPVDSRMAKQATESTLARLHRANHGLPPALPDPIDPKHYPKKWKPGELKAGDAVFYQNERWWVARAPATWEESCGVRICNMAIRPANPLLPDKCTSFYVYADSLSPAPVAKNPFARQPTAGDVERKARARAGKRDIGDPVAEMLRNSKDIYKTAAEFLGVDAKALRDKYGHMDAGRQRMNLGNRMRFKWNKEQGVS